MAGKYMGFDKLKSKLEAEGKSNQDAAAISAAVGRRKYGKKRMQQHAAAGKSFRPR